MGLTNPGRTLGRFSLLSISLKLLTLSGIPPFFINSFRLASLLALLVGLNLSSMIGALVWFFKIGKAVPFESVEVFRKNPFLALYFSLFINDLSASMPSSVSCSLYADDLAIWSSSPSVPTALEAIQRALFRLECWSEYWCLPLNPSKCEASFFSVGPHQANLQPNLLLLGSRLRFNPTPTFLGVTFDRTLFFTEHVSSLKAKFFPRLKALRCISASSCGPSKESLSVLYKSFLRPLLTYASPGWFLFLSATNLTKLERLHRAASRAITGCLSSSPIPLLLTEASLPPLRVTLTHFTLFSYERALCLPTFFPISGLARLGVKPRLCRSSWRALASSHPLMLPFTCSREAFLAVLLGICLCSRWSSPFPLHALALIPLTLAKVRLSPILTLSPIMIWYSGQTVLFLFLLARAAPAFLKPAPFCTPFAGLISTSNSAISLLFSYYLTLVLSSPPCPLLIFSLISNSVADLAGSVFSLLLFYQATMGSRTLVSTGERHG